MLYIFVSIESKACVDYTVVYCTECRQDEKMQGVTGRTSIPA